MAFVWDSPVSHGFSVEEHGGRRGISPAPRSGVFPGAALRASLRVVGAHWALDKRSMPPKKGRGGVRTTKGKGHGHSPWSHGGWGGYGDYCPYCNSRACKGCNCWARPALPKVGKGETQDQFVDRPMWEDSSSHAWTEKGELAKILPSRLITHTPGLCVIFYLLFTMNPCTSLCL